MDKDRVKGKAKDIAGRAERQLGNGPAMRRNKSRERKNRFAEKYRMPGAK